MNLSPLFSDNFIINPFAHLLPITGDKVNKTDFLNSLFESLCEISNMNKNVKRSLWDVYDTISNNQSNRFMAFPKISHASLQENAHGVLQAMKSFLRQHNF